MTLRYEELKAFTIFSGRAPDSDIDTGAAALLGLLDAIVERLARVLDDMGDRVDQTSIAIFKRPPGGNFRPLLTGLSQAQSVTLTRTSLVSLARMLSFAGLAPEIAGDATPCRATWLSCSTRRWA